ncbi:hypothetical protein BDW72DRAFT_197198 [Aspergillus terricola var. indicus]
MLNGRPNEGVALDTDVTAAAQGNVAVEERLREVSVTEGDPEDLVGEVVTGNGEILDEDGDLIGCVDMIREGAPRALDQSRRGAQGGLTDMQYLPVPYKDDVADGSGISIGEEEEARSGSKGLPGEGLPDISTLKGLTCNKIGEIFTEDGAVGELVDGDRKRICREGFQLDDQGRFWDNRGAIVGKAKPIVLEEEEEEEEEGHRPFADKGEVTVAPDLWGDAIHLVGYSVDDDGDIVDGQGNVIGYAVPWEEAEQAAFAFIEGLKPNDRGIMMSAEQEPLARVVKGGWKELAGRPIDKDGLIQNDNGDAIAQVSLISHAIQDVSGPFAGFEDLIVTGSGFVEDATGAVVGRIVEGDATSLKGNSVNKAGEVLDKYGNVRGRAERYRPSEDDLSVLEGLKKLVGKAVGKDGQVCSETDKRIGQVELLPAEEREEQQGSFNGLHNLNMCKDGQTLLEPSGHVVGWHVRRCRSQETLRGMNIPADGKESSNDELQAADGESWGNPAHDDLRNEQPPEAAGARERDEDEKDIHDVLKWL